LCADGGGHDSRIERNHPRPSSRLCCCSSAACVYVGPKMDGYPVVTPIRLCGAWTSDRIGLTEAMAMPALWVETAAVGELPWAGSRGRENTAGSKKFGGQTRRLVLSENIEWVDGSRDTAGTGKCLGQRFGPPARGGKVATLRQIRLNIEEALTSDWTARPRSSRANVATFRRSRAPTE